MFVARLVNATCSYAFSVVLEGHAVLRVLEHLALGRGAVAEDARRPAAIIHRPERGRAGWRPRRTGLALGRRDERRDAASVAGRRRGRETSDVRARTEVPPREAQPVRRLGKGVVFAADAPRVTQRERVNMDALSEHLEEWQVP